MEVDESLARLGDELAGWVLQMLTTYESMDGAAQNQLESIGRGLAREADHLKDDSLTALRLLLNQQSSMAEEDRIAALVRGVEFGSKLAAALYDDLRDVDGHNEVVSLMAAMARALDSIGTGCRTALVPLLQHADPRVRASAGAYLVARIPDRALPVLREVRDHEHASSAHFTADFAILLWETDGE
jgi:hypothetical protein